VPVTSISEIKDQEDPSQPSSFQKLSKSASRASSRRPPGIIGKLSSKKIKVPAEELSEGIRNIVLHANQDYAQNPFVVLYEIQKNLLTKKHGDGLWHTMKTQEILPT
jgi:hypothetical protein